MSFKISQLSVFMENRSGRLASIATALGRAGINIRAISLADTSDFGILRMIVSDTQKAERILRDQGFTILISHVLAVTIPDLPGALGNILSIFEHSGLDVEYMYAFVVKNQDSAVMIFRFEDLDRAIDLMLENDISLINAEKLLMM